MQPTTLLLAALSGFTTLTAAAPCSCPSTNETSTSPETMAFYIKSLSFSGVPHSLRASYSLTVSNSPDAAGTQCHTTTSTSPQITYFNATGCADSDWSFSWTDYPARANSSRVAITYQKHDGAGCSWNFTAERLFDWNDVVKSAGSTPIGDVYMLDTGDLGANFALAAQLDG